MHITVLFISTLTFNQNNLIPFLLQWHVFSLMMFFLMWGRGNLSLTWHHSY